jgi:hypothetical protein
MVILDLIRGPPLARIVQPAYPRSLTGRNPTHEFERGVE